MKGGTDNEETGASGEIKNNRATGGDTDSKGGVKKNSGSLDVAGTLTVVNNSPNNSTDWP
jgi:hypothetical protein